MTNTEGFKVKDVVLITLKGSLMGRPVQILHAEIVELTDTHITVFPFRSFVGGEPRYIVPENFMYDLEDVASLELAMSTFKR